MPKVLHSASGSQSKFITFGLDRFVIETEIRKKKIRKRICESHIEIFCWRVSGSFNEKFFLSKVEKIVLSSHSEM